MIERIPGIHWLSKFRKYLEWQRLQTTLTRIDAVERIALLSDAQGISSEQRGKNITVSLTTYGHRIHDVHAVIESLFQQTLQANRIVLWLSKTEFSPGTVPAVLNTMASRGLELRFCEDLRSYKKIIPLLGEGTEDAIITVDDDIIYPTDTIERLYRAHLEHPDRVHCNRAHLMRLDGGANILPYRRWGAETSLSDPSLLVFPTGCSGVIYSAKLFHSDVMDQRTFMELSPTADDIWLKVMTLRNRVACQLVPHPRPYSYFLKIPDYRASSLVLHNRRANDQQLQRLVARYPDITNALRAGVA